MNEQRMTFAGSDRSGWYRRTDDGYEYLGTERPDDLTDALLVDCESGRVYQNSGGNIAVDEAAIPNATWTTLVWEDR